MGAVTDTAIMDPVPGRSPLKSRLPRHPKLSSPTSPATSGLVVAVGVPASAALAHAAVTATAME